ncbi:hypothetical protein NDA18_001529 [Ustilago nuda]|nr:hypothetical protein NDA18_001529 [Ustilago nuda]
MASRCRTCCASGALRTTRLRTFALTASSSSSSSILAPPSKPKHRRKHQPIRLSTHFSPTLKPSQTSTSDSSLLPSLELLLRGGYMRPSSSGIFTLLPNSLRLISKIQSIIDRELASISCTRLSLPSLLPSTLYHVTNRYTLIGSELYKLQDRKQSEFLLAPTHEEEITKLVSSEIESDRQLPLRLYQITRKFRDEPRPRMGLLRTKEFLMKDLYTFDKSESDALKTYQEVRRAYGNIFDSIFGKVPAWSVAEADTGAIGGNTSHEYHVQDAAGEDTLISCAQSLCGYCANKEKAVSLPEALCAPVQADDVRVLLYGCTHVKVQDQVLHAFVVAKARGLNGTKLEKLVAKLKTNAQQLAPQQQQQKSVSKPSKEHVVQQETKVELLYDSSHSGATQGVWDWQDRPEGPLVRFTSLSLLSDLECASLDPAELNQALTAAVNIFASRPTCSSSSSTVKSSDQLPLIDLFPAQFGSYAINPTQIAPPLTLVDIRNAASNDTCPSCRTPHSLRETKAIEVGHTFYLGDRYSRPLEAGFLPTAEAKKENEGVHKLPNGRIPFQMGCYGIGVSRILAALAQKAAAEFDTRFNAGLLQGAKKRHGFLWPTQVAPYTAVVVVADAKDQVRVNGANEIYERVVEAARRADCSVRQVLQWLVVENGGQSVEQVEAEEEDDSRRGWSSEEAHELVIDDRQSCTLGSKLADSDLTGYSYRIIVGKHFSIANPEEARVELQYISPTEKGAAWKSLLLPLSAFDWHPTST